jgi:hypothetical protein
MGPVLRGASHSDLEFQLAGMLVVLVYTSGNLIYAAKFGLVSTAEPCR